MPNTKSAEKRVRTNEIRAERNKQRRSRLRTAIKKVGQTETVESAEAAFKEATILIDRAAARNVIHRNKAARLKSQLAGLVKEKSAAA